MEELLRDFLTESVQRLRAIVPRAGPLAPALSPGDVIDDIFALAHDISGACGFLDLPRVGRLAGATEEFIDRSRRKGAADRGALAPILGAVERIDAILTSLEPGGGEPFGDDSECIANLTLAGEAPAVPRGMPVCADPGAVLIVEPVAVLRDVASRALTREGFTAVAVEDANDAIRELASGREYLAILVDIDLAAAAGAFTERLRAASAHATPALIGSAPHGGAISQARAHASGLRLAVGKFDRAAILRAARQVTTRIAA